ncbi:MAG TPA: acetyl-CoA carboxylase, carboxyltransferase subunit beta [bacterium]|nr:acetyl-CoA carboxylase, carboxyltransferase subunit beta [bacterium]HPO82511.1 acetyl-CoA carboxylase, carboxyltransferase subunit beta [bacterium]
MHISDWFSRKPKYAVLKPEKKEIPEGLWTRCPKCLEIIYNKELERNLKVCTKCGYHFKLNAWERIFQLVDNKEFYELDGHLESVDALPFDDGIYIDKLKEDKEKTGLTEAIVSGKGKLEGFDILLGVFDFGFIGGSMASVVGEKVTRLFEYGIEEQLPVIIVTATGGARMYEGMLSLMQMAKTNAALGRYRKSRGLFISVLADPSTAGVMASFASQGDVIIAEPGALIGFAGPRVIEQTIKQKLPEGFQSSEFVFQHGMVDMIVDRNRLKSVLGRIIKVWKMKQK